MRKLVIYAPAYLPVNRKSVESLLEPGADWRVEVVFKPEELDQVIRDAEVLIAFPTDPDIIARGTKLRWVQALSVGVDAFPVKVLTERGVVMTNGKGIHQIHMAEYAIGAMIMLARSLPVLMRRQFRGEWKRTSFQGEINGTTVGILGLGTIGREVARRAAFMGMRVIGVKNRPEPVSHVTQVMGPEAMDQVFAQSDYLINLLPGTPDTYQVIDWRLLSLMKPEACLINMGRGQTIKEADLIRVLQEGGIRFFWSDVFEEEPLPPESPLWGMENVVITPHICGESRHYMDKAMGIIAHNLKVYQTGKGRMINRVDLSKGY